MNNSITLSVEHVRVVEDTFGVLANRFRIFLGSIHWCNKGAVNICLAYTTWYNFLSIFNAVNHDHHYVFFNYERLLTRIQSILRFVSIILKVLITLTKFRLTSNERRFDSMPCKCIIDIWTQHQFHPVQYSYNTVTIRVISIGKGLNGRQRGE